MASQQEWHHKIRDALDSRVERRDVWLALHVDADPSLPLEALDDEEFAGWAGDWIDFTVESTAGPLMPGVAETEWATGENDELMVRLMLSKRSRSDGPLVGNPEPTPGSWVGE